MTFLDKMAEEVNEYMEETIKVNNLSYVDEELVNIIFRRYVYEFVKAAVFKWLYLFAMIALAVYILMNDAINLPYWFKILVSFVILRYSKVGVWSIGGQMYDEFSNGTVPDIFNQHKDLWKIETNNRKDDI